MKIFVLMIMIFITACAKPGASVFLDNSLLEEENVKFCFTGDMGKDTPHQRVIADALNREQCHRIFFLGDLVYPNGISSLEDEEFTKKFLAYYEPLLEDNPNQRINLILGNHDHKGKPEVWKKIADVNDHFFFPGYYYMIDYGGLCIVAMDTSFYYYTNNVLELSEQTQWIQGLQPRLKKCDVKVALTHHPFKGSGMGDEDDWKGATGALKVFLDTYVIGVFDIHLAGHVHVVADDGKDEGTRMLISGAGGETRGTNRAGYIILNWNSSNPKRIGYALKYIDTTLGVIDDSESSQKQEEEFESEYVIDKMFVEESFLKIAWFKLITFFKK